jgi:flavin-dependent dehydrogenase
MIAPCDLCVAHELSPCRDAWDLVVIGGGPAGAAAAITAARLGIRTLVIDRSQHPRSKVCGSCLSPLALERLRALGLSSVTALGAPLRTVRVDCCGSLTEWRRSGVALSRSQLDAELLRTAAAAGARVMTGVVAEAQPSGLVTLRSGSAVNQLNARLVIAADGIGGSSVRSSSRLRWRTLPRARIGFGTTIAHDAIDLCADELLMCVRYGGYVGAVSLGEGMVDIAAAASPDVVRSAGGPAALVLRWLDRWIIDRNRVTGAVWVGTPRLTRRRRAATDEHIIVAGDAFGYVEPFTGEGIGWALASGIAAAEHAERVLSGRARVSAWERTARRMSAWPHARCASMALFVRAPRTLGALLRAGRCTPLLAARIGGAWGVQRSNAAFGGAAR